jgi:hypothetical protein
MRESPAKEGRRSGIRPLRSRAPLEQVPHLVAHPGERGVEGVGEQPTDVTDVLAYGMILDGVTGRLERFVDIARSPPIASFTSPSSPACSTCSFSLRAKASITAAAMIARSRLQLPLLWGAQRAFGQSRSRAFGRAM